MVGCTFSNNPTPINRTSRTSATISTSAETPTSEISTSATSNPTSVVTTSEPTSLSTSEIPTSVTTSVSTSDISTSIPTSISTSVVTSTPTSISTSNPTSQSTSKPTSASSSTSKPTSATSSTTSEIPAVTVQKIGTIRSERKINQYVCFEATYLRRLAFVHDDVLFFADDTGSIAFRIQNGLDYIKNGYRFKEYRVTGKLVENNGNLEVAYDTNITSSYKDAVVRLGDTHALSYDETKTLLPTQLNNIGDIETIAGGLTLDNKSYGYSEQLVKFTAKYVQNERENSSEKTMFVDEKGRSIVVIMDGDGTGGHPLYDLRNTNNFGKYYSITGIVSVRYSIPAILGLRCEYVEHTLSEESTVDVSIVTEVTSEVATEIFKGNLTSDKFKALPNSYYFSLYKVEGWVVDNTDITTSYNFGLTLTEGGSISDTTTNKNTVKGFYFVNGTNIKDSGLSYCPYDEYLNKKICVYFKIESYDTNNHLWKIFVIENLITEVS